MRVSVFQKNFSLFRSTFHLKLQRNVYRLRNEESEIFINADMLFLWSNDVTTEQAEYLADLFGGKVCRPSWGSRLVIIERQDNHLVVINDESISEYKNKPAFSERYPKSIIWFE